MQEAHPNRYAAGFERLNRDLKTVLNDVQMLLQARMGTLKEQASAAAQKTDRTVRAYPYQSIAIAFGIGLGIGVLAAIAVRSRAEEADECSCPNGSRN